jgi:hypothetical protein
MKCPQKEFNALMSVQGSDVPEADLALCCPPRFHRRMTAHTVLNMHNLVRRKAAAHIPPEKKLAWR